jgi:membrane protein implicated in regulation of membrane protease activity
MGIGAGIFLLALGAILAFAVSATVSGINISTVGVILMIVGALGIVLDLVIWAPRRRGVRTTTVSDPGYVGRGRVVEERESLL